jgi:hypothetical protein
MQQRAGTARRRRDNQPTHRHADTRPQPLLTFENPQTGNFNQPVRWAGTRGAGGRMFLLLLVYKRHLLLSDSDDFCVLSIFILFIWPVYATTYFVTCH